MLLSSSVHPPWSSHIKLRRVLHSSVWFRNRISRDASDPSRWSLSRLAAAFLWISLTRTRPFSGSFWFLRKLHFDTRPAVLVPLFCYRSSAVRFSPTSSKLCLTIILSEAPIRSTLPGAFLPGKARWFAPTFFVYPITELFTISFGNARFQLASCRPRLRSCICAIMDSKRNRRFTRFNNTDSKQNKRNEWNQRFQPITVYIKFPKIYTYWEKI